MREELSDGSFPGAASEAKTPDITTLSRQSAVERLHRDAARQELSSEQTELHQVKDENDEPQVALVPLHSPFH